MAASAATLSMPAILRHTRAFAQQPVFKVGYSSALTGSHAATAEPDPFVLGEMKTILGEGVENNGRRVKIEIYDRDSESSHAGQTAEDLIFGERVDLIAATSAPDSIIPVANVAEINGVPCITTDSPWQPFFFGRDGDPEIGFDWTFHFNWGLEDIITAFVAFWSKQELNRTVGGLYAGPFTARYWVDAKTGFPAKLQEVGFNCVYVPVPADPSGPSAPPSNRPLPDDLFHEQIDAFKAANCEIMTGNLWPREVARFWDRASARDYRPKIATVSRGLIFPSRIKALGDRVDRMSTEVWWSPSFPYRSSLTGQSAQQLADAYTAATGRPWTMALGEKHALFEVIADVVKRTADLDNPSAIVDAIATTRLETVTGLIEWTGRPVKNVAKTPLVTGQWQKDDGDFSLVIVDTATHPEIPVGGELQLIE